MRVCVVGAGGASGAAACRALCESGHVVVPLDEAAEPGGVWRTLPPTFLADTSRSQMRLCSRALGSGKRAKDYPMAEEVLNHVRQAAYPSVLYLHRVTVVDRLSAGKWHVAGLHVETGVEFRIDVDAVVVATGACSVPYYPPFAQACFAQQRIQHQLQQQQRRKSGAAPAPKHRVRSQGMSIVHSHHFPWKNAAEFAGQVESVFYLCQARI
jgi:cation diffusion facilitator CzcD-associated flavoprotein CzcO